MIHRGIYMCVYVISTSTSGVATISRLLKIIGLFCKRALQKRPIFSKETYNCKKPTDRIHTSNTPLQERGARIDWEHLKIPILRALVPDFPARRTAGPYKYPRIAL